MTTHKFDISEIMRIEMNKAIEKTIRRNPTVRILNIDEMSTDDIATYFQKNRTMEQLQYLFEGINASEYTRNYEFARWFRIVLGELHTIASNNQSR